MKNTEKKLKKSGLKRGLLIGLAAVLVTIIVGGLWIANQERRYGDNAPIFINGKKSKLTGGRYDVVGLSGTAIVGIPGASLQPGDKYVGIMFHGGTEFTYSPKSAKAKLVPHKAQLLKFDTNHKVVPTSFGTYVVGKDITKGQYKLTITQPADANLFVQVNQQADSSRFKKAQQRTQRKSELTNTQLLVDGKPYTKIEPNEQAKHPAMTYVSDVKLVNNGDSLQIENWSGDEDENGNVPKLIPDKALKITIEKIK